MMLHIFDENIVQNTNTAITLGNFDGLHLGHQKLIYELKKISKLENLTSALFSFYPHPVTVLKDIPIRSILSREEKINLLKSIGIDIFVEYPFNKKFASVEPEDFVKSILCNKMRCKVLIVGKGYKFGAGQKGTCSFLEQLGKKYGIQVIVTKVVNDFDMKISSSSIRQHIHEKNFQQAETLLSRPYFVSGNIQHGKKIGRTIGFPTANILPSSYKLLPPNGVYITRTHCKGTTYNSITNIGTNPTVNGINKTVETYLFDFDDEIYGEFVKVDFYSWIRDEQKFENVDMLKERLNLDVLQAKSYFTKIH